MTYVCKMVSFAHTMSSVRYYVGLLKSSGRSEEAAELLEGLPPKAL